MNWQRANVEAAVSYLSDCMARGAADARTRAVYEGLLDLLEPSRRTKRLQRELARSMSAAVSVQPSRDRRIAPDRRSHRDRRIVNLAGPAGVERRSGGDRRSGNDRRRR